MENNMRTILIIAIINVLLISSCRPKKTTTVSYPEKFEGLTQLVLASETKTLVFSETSVQKVLGFKLGSAEVKVTASVTFDFYVDFDKDGYEMSFSSTGDTLTFKAPLLRVKKPASWDVHRAWAIPQVPHTKRNPFPRFASIGLEPFSGHKLSAPLLGRRRQQAEPACANVVNEAAVQTGPDEQMLPVDHEDRLRILAVDDRGRSRRQESAVQVRS